MHNWMTQLYGLVAPGAGAPGALGIDTAFGDRLLNQILMPGTHDAGCYLDHNTLNSWYSQTQQLDIAAQLDHGIRYFDLRPSRYWSMTQWAEEWWTYHGLYYGGRLDGAAGILQAIAQFMHNHHLDQELVILNFSHFSNFDAARHIRFIRLVQSFLWDFLVPHNQAGTAIGALAYHALLTGATPPRPLAAPAPPSLPPAPGGGYGIGPRSRVMVIYDGALDQNREPLPMAGLGSLLNQHGFWVLDPKYPPGGLGVPPVGAYPPANGLLLFDQYSNSRVLDTMRSDQLNKLRNRAGRPYTARPWNPGGAWNNNPPGGVPGTMHLFSWTLTPQPWGYPVTVAANTTNPAMAPLFAAGHFAGGYWPVTEARPYNPQLDPMLNILYVDVSDSLQHGPGVQPWSGFDMPVALAMYINNYIAIVPWDNWANW